MSNSLRQLDKCSPGSSPNTREAPLISRDEVQVTTSNALISSTMAGNSLALRSPYRWHAALQFFEPVQDDIDLRFAFPSNHQEALAIGRHVVIGERV